MMEFISHRRMSNGNGNRNDNGMICRKDKLDSIQLPKLPSIAFICE